MKIFTAQQIREGDAYTIEHEPVSSIDLMERAARQCTTWLTGQFCPDRPVFIFCGTGNNGGDGLALTRQLHQKGYTASACLVGNGDRLSPDGKINLKRLEHEFASRLFSLHSIEEFPELPDGAIIVDALFGTGLNRPLEGLARAVVRRINDASAAHAVIAIDIPSGLVADGPSAGDIIHASHTLSFEFYKLAFLFPGNAAYVGEVHILPIGIPEKYKEQTDTPYSITDEAFLRAVYRQRAPFAHKGTYGHALLVAGSYGKMGAAVLSSGACLHAGAGLVTGYIPSCGYEIFQISVPEAMCICDPESKYLTQVPGNAGYGAIGIGPGIGMKPQTADMLRNFLTGGRRPLVLDADALNIIAKENLFDLVPAGSVLTPHPKEFERLFGKTADDFERLALQLAKSRERNICIVLKGHHTSISSPEGACFFNPTGNAGMATGGSGDVLTGILTALIAQGYPPFDAAVLGVYIHGLAGDIAAGHCGMESLSASDIIASLGRAFLTLAVF